MSIELSELLAPDTTKKAEYENAPWYVVLGLGQAGWWNYGIANFNTLYAKALGGAKPQPPSTTDLLEHSHRMFDVNQAVRVTKAKKGYTVSMPIYHDNFDPRRFFQSGAGWYSVDGKNIARALDKALPGLLDPAMIFDKSFRDIALQESSLDLGFEDADALEQISQAVVGFRLVSPPCQRAIEHQATGISPAVRDAWANGTADSYTARAFVEGLLRARVVTLFVELEVSEGSAEYICQGPAKLSLLGEYFARAMRTEHLFADKGKWVHNIVPISKIASANAQNKAPVVARVDENDLAVDEKGELLWLPTVDNTEFVEAEVEAGGLQPDGSWTGMDVVDPENNEYIRSGRNNVRQRKPKGRNQLVYTDWHNARLSYTDDDGHLETVDLSMYRPATVGQLARILGQNVTGTLGRENAEVLRYAVERGVALGAQVAHDPTLYEPYFTAQESAEITAVLNEGKLIDWANKIKDRFDLIAKHGMVNGRRLSPDELNTFDTIVADWLILDLIHANSPMLMCRLLADLLTQAYEKATANQDQIFGRYVVRTTLREMATLGVVVKYAGQRNQLIQVDLQERAKYVAPDLTPADQIEVNDVPFVSGNVELFPHQVKVWNYLKNSPKNVVLDVAAGGGKTLLCLLDVAYHIGKGMRYPLIACPENLIKNYIEDASWLFAGKMNMVVINNTTMNSPEWGEERLRDLVMHAPPNTIFLTDYNFLIPRRGSKRMRTLMYGAEVLDISLNTEFLKSIPWGGMWMDESHLTKNPNGSTNKELMRLTSTIPFKRQLSGTYISDNLTDVVGQFGILNPQTFGDQATFLEEFFEDGKKGAPMKGAQRRIRSRMSENANVITIRRKEWAALLPRRSDQFWSVDMSPAQRAVYSKILTAQRQDLMDRAKEDPELAALLGTFNGAAEEGDANPDGPAQGDDQGEAMDRLLTFYLQRLERFITAPMTDPLGQELLGADRISPKMAKLVEILNSHVKAKIPGKVLIWTQYVESASSIYQGLPADLREQAIWYTAADAEQAMAEFKSNPKKRFMVGCEKSMNTGHNLQFCSRIIRLETVWNWGTLEQGEARINRPTLNDPRRHENGGQGIYYDWIFCNYSMDVTKNARMLSKLLSTVKFYEQDIKAYEDLPDLPTVKLSQDNIFSMNDWRDHERGCADYFDAYQQYAVLEQQQFDEFVNNPDNRIEPYTLEEGAIIEGSGILKQVPYIPQMRLYGSDKLGLIPFVQYTQSTYGTGKKKQTLLGDDPTWSPQGLKIHTEYGDCVAVDYNRNKGGGKPRTMRVLAPNGKTVTVPLTMAWVITKESANGEDVRARIAKRIGVDLSQDVVVPKKIVELPPEDTSPPKPGQRRAPPDNEGPGFDVWLETYNHLLSLVVNTEDIDAAKALPQLKRLGFVEVPNYHYAKPTNPKALRKWIDAVQAKVEIHPEYLARLEADCETWRKGLDLKRFAEGLAASGRKTYLTSQKQPLPKGLIKPYLVAHNNQQVFLCLNVRVNAASWNRVRAVTVPGIAWKMVEGEHWYFAQTKQDAQRVAKELFATQNITNRDELVQDFAKVRVTKIVKE